MDLLKLKKKKSKNNISTSKPSFQGSPSKEKCQQAKIATLNFS